MRTPTPGFTDVVGFLRERLQHALPGADAQLQMAPAYRRDPETIDIAGKPCREAAVLALLFPVGNACTILFTLRHHDLADHAGQISFPGGRVEAGETRRETALREAREEVGLSADRVDILGALTPLYIPPTSYCVYPYVGAVPDRPALEPHDAEVTALLEVPLTYLLAASSQRIRPWEHYCETVEIPYYHIDGYPPLWGATAMMLAELLELFE